MNTEEHSVFIQLSVILFDLRVCSYADPPLASDNVLLHLFVGKVDIIEN